MEKDKAKRRRLKQMTEASRDMSGESTGSNKSNGDEDELKRRQEELEHKLNQLLELQNVFTAILSTLDIEDLLSRIAETTVNTLGYDHSLVVALDDKKGVPTATAFFSKSDTTLASEIEKLILHSVTETPQQPLIDSTEEKPAKQSKTLGKGVDSTAGLDYNAIHELLGARNMIAMPLIARNHIMGDIIAFTDRDDITGMEDDPLWILANQSAIALDNLRLYDEAMVSSQKLRESREMSRVTLENAITGVSIVQDGEFKYINPIFEEMLGYKSHELIGKPTADYIHPDDRERVIQEVIASLKGDIKPLHEFRLISRDGNPVWVLEKVASINFKSSRAILAIALDISELKRTEQALRESEEKLNIVFDSIKDGIVVTDLKINMLQVNEAARRLAGYPSKAEMIGRNALDFITAEDIEKALQPMNDAVQGRPIDWGDFKLRSKLGEEFDAEIGISTLHDAEGGMAGFVTVIHDITERKRMESLIRASEEKLRFMFESIGEGIVVTDLNGKSIDENMAAMHMFGFNSKEEIIGVDGLSFIAEKDRETAMHNMMRVLQEGGGETMEITLVDRNGGEFEGEISTALLRDRSGEPSGFICVIRDITVRKKMEQAKSDFVALVSHQLKTPVAGIKGYIENMLDGLAGEMTDKQRQYVLDMRKLCERNYRLISDLLNTSMIERGILTIDLGPTDLRSVVNSSLEDYHAKIEEKGLELRINGTNERINVLSDRDKLVETLSNLINNALKFTDEGSISISIGSDGEYGIIEVSDTGWGMDSEAMDNLFKRDKVLSGGPVAGGGAGLGLYIAKGFMQAQNGDITATSTPGKGTSFILKVPIYKDS